MSDFGDGRRLRNGYRLLQGLCLIGFVLIFSPTAAWGTTAGSSGYGRSYKSPHFLGRGDTGIAIADDHEAIFYNPAGLALGDKLYKGTVLASPSVEFSSAGTELYRKAMIEQDMSVETIQDLIGTPQHIGFQNLSAITFRRAAFGFTSNNEADLLIQKARRSSGLESIDIGGLSINTLTFSVAEAFWEQSLMIGLTAKYMPAAIVAGAGLAVTDLQNLETAFDPASLFAMGSGMGYDFGLMYRLKDQQNTSFGLTITDIGNTSITGFEGETLPQMKQIINLGVAMQPTSNISKMRLLMDFRDVLGAYESNIFKRLHLGSEITLQEYIGFSFGLHQGYPSGGAYLDFRVFRIDLGIYTQEIGNRAGDRPDTRYYFRLMSVI